MIELPDETLRDKERYPIPETGMFVPVGTIINTGDGPYLLLGLYDDEGDSQGFASIREASEVAMDTLIFIETEERMVIRLKVKMGDVKVKVNEKHPDYDFDVRIAGPSGLGPRGAGALHPSPFAIRLTRAATTSS